MSASRPSAPVPAVPGTTLREELAALPGAALRRLRARLGRRELTAPRGPDARPARFRPARVVPGPSARGYFDAGEGSRVRATWGTWSYSANAEVFSYLRTIRARSRGHARNNPYMMRFLSVLGDNVVGPEGVGFQAVPLRDSGPMAGTIDLVDARVLEELWALQSEAPNWTTGGRTDRAAGELQLMETAAVDGEYLAIIVRGYARSATGWALRPLDADRLDLNRNRSRDPATGVRTVMGVDLDDNDVPVGYWILRTHPDATWPDAGGTARTAGEYMPGPSGEPPVPADDVVHCFIPHRLEAVRGLPWARASLTGMEDESGFREAAVVAARYGAMRLGWYREETSEPMDRDAVDEHGRDIQDAELGTFGRLPPGVSLESWDPKYPDQMYASFQESIIRSIGAGLDVSYHSLGNDLSNVNFSSANVGVHQERDVWRRLQRRFLIAQLHRRVYPDWLRWMLATGRIPIPPSRQPKLERVRWRPRTWESINRVRDASADAMLYGMGAKTMSEIIRDRGEEPEDVWAERAREDEQMAAAGVVPTMPSTLVPTPEPEDEQEPRR